MPHLTQASLDALQICCAPERVLQHYLERVAYASDASFYRLIPQAVVQPESPSEIQALFAWSQHWQVPLTFRAAGTSLSGQAITSGVLVDLSRHWRAAEVLDAGQAIRLQPGVIGAHANALLRPYQRKIGPDPASLQACMLGGILANNASGMCCGVQDNAYHTLRSLSFVLPDGTTLNSAAPHAATDFVQKCPQLAQTLQELRQEFLAQPTLAARVRAKYRYKNTVGYSLNALLDYRDPLEIFVHLLIGSEGTLAFISEAVLETVPAPRQRLTGLLFFDGLIPACQAVPRLTASGAAAIELLDTASLRSLSAQTLQDLQAEALMDQPEPVALLVEYQAADAAELAAQEQHAHRLWAQLPLAHSTGLSREPHLQALYWKVRKGLYPSVGAVRQSGTAVIIEDVLFPPEQLAEGVSDLRALFGRHGYEQAIVFGHARDGNLHFVLTQAFDSEAEIQRYNALMQDLAQVVLQRGGALKAEHGTGRNMAPFVEAEWGAEALSLMQRLKTACDPQNLLNPGVILNPDPDAHLQHLKTLPSIDAEVDRCTECGFCEPACPSRRLSLSPRQRIVLRREMVRLQDRGDAIRLQDLQQGFHYSGEETCATDGLCALACPVGIDTGHLIKRLRSERITPALQNQVSALARRFQQLETGLRLSLGGAHILSRILGAKTLNGLRLCLESLTGTTLPRWSSNLPPARFDRLPHTGAEQGEQDYCQDYDEIYFPSCLSRSLGYAKRPDLPHTLVHLAQRADRSLGIPAQTEGLCCGLPFASKGFEQAGSHLRQRTLAHLWSASHHGKIPVVCDTSPCTLHLREGLNGSDFEGLQILDLVQYLEQTLAPRLPLEQRHHEVVLHPVCAVKKMGLEAQLIHLAQRCAHKVTVPLGAGCCGFAGDRGLLFPELPQSALADSSAELAGVQADFYCASSRSCEMGLSLTLERPYESIVYLLANSLKLESQ